MNSENNRNSICWTRSISSGPPARRRWQARLHLPVCIAGILACLALDWLWIGAIPARADGPVPLNPAATWLSGDSAPTLSLAWGDVDGDGDLDLAVGDDGPNKLYLNENGVLQTASAWWSDDDDSTACVAWGDVDGDGDLDLAVGNGTHDVGQPNRLYLNESGTLQTTAAWVSSDSDNTQSVAWGDVDGDGDLDLAVVNGGGELIPLGQPNKLYLNEDGILQTTAAWQSGDSDETYSVAWGDVDGDGDLDLAVGNDGPNKVYLNEDGTLQTTAAWQSGDSDDTYSVAWGDVDGDGDLDLAVGNGNASDGGQPNKLYLNEGGTLQTAAAWHSGESDATWSVAWGDVDGDGDLDLAVGNYGLNKLYLNENGTLQTTAAWVSSDSDNTQSVAWGDVEGDGDLDLAVVNGGGELITLGQPNKLYLNEGGILQTAAAWQSGDSDDTYSVAWGDVDGDGDLDLAVGNDGPNKVYLNEDGTLQTTAAWQSDDGDDTLSVAWGDVDGDGDLDLAAGNWAEPNKVYLNEGGTLQATAAWRSGDSDNTWSVAWGDVDGDGDLDLAAGNEAQPNKIYLNEKGTLQTIAAWQSDDSESTRSVAWGDVDGDGDLDLAVGNEAQPNRLYLNEGGTLQTTAAWQSDDRNYTVSVAWGDVDGDGDLDLAAGNCATYQPNKLYLNGSGMLQTAAIWQSDDGYAAWSVAWGDVDGDGDLDLAVGNSGPSKVHLNEGGRLQTTAAWQSGNSNVTWSVAWGDVDGDGHLDLAAGDYAGPNKVYLNQRSAHPLYPGQTTAVAIDLSSDPVQTFSQTAVVTALAPANYYAVPGVRQSGLIPFTYTLFHPASELTWGIRAFYSPDGGGRWLEAAAATGAPTTDLAAGPYPTITLTNTHVFTWSIWESGLFGQSDNVVFRIEALPNLRPVTNSIPGPYQWPYVSAQTFPFRVRGSQVRVYSETAAAGNEAAGALVYRLPAGQASGGDPFADSAGQVFRTDSHGYLQGRGEIGLGDRLLAMLPITWTESYTLYYTSGAPTAVGLDAFSVISPGVQVLTVTADHPLYLFNLDVSLEWDAHNDAIFMEQLEYNLQRASEYLYDFTDGQAALGEVYVFHDAENWQTAHLRVYANNRLRPNAVLGGVISGTITDTLMPEITYEAGQIRMPATWNRYGDPGGSIGEDWPRTLAHEFGHYYLFLDDHYLGLNKDGQVISIDTCLDTAMTDPYRYSEYRDQADWLPDCADTMANHLTGRSDWATIELFYPELIGPDERGFNAGPTLMPFNFTEITLFDPLTPTQTLADPTFYFLTEDGQRYQPAEGTRGFLLKDDTWLLDVGEPVIDHILARGAKVGDRLCVFDAASSRLACEEIQAGDDQVVLYSFPDWRPEIIVSPVATNSIGVAVHTAESLSLQGRIFSIDGPATEVFDFTETASGTYEATITSTNVLLLEGFIQIWVDESVPRREMITDYSIGASPGAVRGHSGAVRGHGGAVRGHGGAVRGHGGAVRGHGVPILSGDGQVTIYTPDPTIPDGEFLTIQAATGTPELPPGRVQIGQAYRIAATEGTTNLDESSISFQYLGEAVPAGMEEDSTIYYWDGDEATWHALPTTLDMMDNFASAQISGSGLYALLTAYRVPLYAPGWNLFSYPLRSSQPVTAALVSISGYYTTVYGYDARESVWEAWKVYDVTVPDYVNDLEGLEFGRVYWINVSQAITMYVGGTGEESGVSVASLPSQVPATYYGEIVEGRTPGESITAWVGGNLCGQGQTLEVGDQIVYVIKVLAEAGGPPGCGGVGREVTFQVGSQIMNPTVSWDDERLWEVQLSSSTGPMMVYLPLVLKEN